MLLAAQQLSRPRHRQDFLARKFETAQKGGGRGAFGLPALQRLAVPAPEITGAGCDPDHAGRAGEKAAREIGATHRRLAGRTKAESVHFQELASIKAAERFIAD